MKVALQPHQISTEMFPSWGYEKRGPDNDDLKYSVTIILLPNHLSLLHQCEAGGEECRDLHICSQPLMPIQVQKSLVMIFNTSEFSMF